MEQTTAGTIIPVFFY